MRRALPGLLLLCAAGARAEFSGNIAAEAQYFPKSPQFEDQFDQNLTFSFEPRWDGESNDGNDLWSAELFLRADNKDAGREHADIRELLWLHIDGDNEWRVGINTMFWGVTESKHLVDVINQIDAVEGIDGEEKLGQPMVHLKSYRDWGVLDFLVLPYFRERTFHAKEGRLRPGLVVDTDQAEYESSNAQYHTDYALRFSQIYGDLDLGLHLFDGTNRDPVPLPGTDDRGNPVLIPFYEQMTQFGLDSQLLYEDWIWKLEAIYRDASSNNYYAWTGGFEYTFYGILESVINFGALLEYSYDSRPEGERGSLDRDVFLGGRFAFNDVQSTEILAGFIVDTHYGSQRFRVEASRRLGDSWKASLELQTFHDIDPDDIVTVFKQDDYLLVEMAYYF
jgi:hypothetical protein